MDPDACLKEMLELAESIRAEEYEVDSEDADRLAELVQALDKWILSGGFLPRRWQERSP